MSGFGGKNSRELSSCQIGKLRVSEKYKGGADGLIRSIGAESILLWADAKDITAADGDLDSWVVRSGGEPDQTTESKKPNFNSTGWDPDGGPSVEFDGVGEALVSTDTVDLDSIDKVSVFCTLKIAGGALAHIWEYGAQFSLNSGFALGFDASDQPYVGIGDGGFNYLTSNTARDGEAICLGGVADRSLVLADEIALYINGIEETDFTRGPGSGDMGDNFAASQGSWIGSRNDGSSRPLNGGMREIIIIKESALSEQQAWLISSALNYKAKIA